MRKVKVGAHLIWAVVAGTAGLFVLLGYFIDLEIIVAMRLVLMRWAVLIAAWALILGIVNILYVHFIKVRDMEPGWPYSILLMIALFVTIFFGFISVDNEIMVVLFNYIHLPIETSLMALLAISLAVAGFRLVSQKRDWTSMVFAGTAFFVLLGTLQWPLISDEMYKNFSGLRDWLVQVLASGGARGILLGVALGAIVTGLRVLLAVDRPYGD
jgi:hypothetical protein